MAKYVDGPLTALAGAAILEGQLVKFSSAKTSTNPITVALAGLAEDFLGIAAADTPSGGLVTVLPKNKQGTAKLLSSGAFSAGAKVYGRALGKVDDIATSSAVLVGIALEAASGANELVEVLLTQA